MGRAQNSCILTGFRVVSVSAVLFRLYGVEDDVSRRITGLTVMAVGAILQCEPIGGRIGATADHNRRRGI